MIDKIVIILRPKTTNTYERIQEIEQSEGIKVFQYRGSEIYSKASELSKDFWNYVCENLI